MGKSLQAHVIHIRAVYEWNYPRISTIGTEVRYKFGYWGRYCTRLNTENKGWKQVNLI